MENKSDVFVCLFVKKGKKSIFRFERREGVFSEIISTAPLEWHFVNCNKIKKFKCI